VTDFKKYKSDLVKIRPVEAELFHADNETDRQTDMTKLILALRNFANAPKNCVAKFETRDETPKETRRKYCGKCRQNAQTSTMGEHFIWLALAVTRTVFPENVGLMHPVPVTVL